MKVGDKITIIDYGRPNDEELIEWAMKQPKNEFKITQIDIKSKTFYIENCEYAIPFDSIDYK